jgi:hypothetical protein
MYVASDRNNSIRPQYYIFEGNITMNTNNFFKILFTWFIFFIIISKSYTKICSVFGGENQYISQYFSHQFSDISAEQLKKNEFTNIVFEMVLGTSFDSILEEAFEQTIKKEIENIDIAAKKCNLTLHEKQFIFDLLTDKYLPQKALDTNNEWIDCRINFSVKFFTKSQKIKKDTFVANMTIWGTMPVHIVKISSYFCKNRVIILTNIILIDSLGNHKTIEIQKKQYFVQ